MFMNLQCRVYISAQFQKTSELRSDALPLNLVIYMSSVHCFVFLSVYICECSTVTHMFHESIKAASSSELVSDSQLSPPRLNTKLTVVSLQFIIFLLNLSEGEASVRRS